MVGSFKTVYVLVHGLCSTSDELLTVKHALEKAGLTTCSWTIPGYSFDANQEHQVASSYDHWIEFLHEQIVDLRAQHSTPVQIQLIGLSAGANLILGLSIKHPSDVQSLVLLSTPLWIDGWSVPFYHWLLPLALYTPLGAFWRYEEKEPFGVKNERIRAWIKKQLSERRISSAGASVLEIGHLRAHDQLRRFVRKTLPHAKMPTTLMIHAKEDEVASLNNVKWLRDHWQGSTLSYVELGNSYHMITIDNDRQQVCEEILGFTHTLQTVNSPVV
jgi:carboxylesterase